MSGTLVGPLPVVRFGPFGLNGKVVYSPPRDTLDVRYALCTDHRVACDCREAEWAEERQERRLRNEEIREAFDRILDGHSTFVVGEPNRWTGDPDASTVWHADCAVDDPIPARVPQVCPSCHLTRPCDCEPGGAA